MSFARLLLVKLLLLTLCLSFRLSAKVQVHSLSDLVDQVDSRCRVIEDTERKYKCFKAFKRSYKEQLSKEVYNFYGKSQKAEKIIAAKLLELKSLKVQ